MSVVVPIKSSGKSKSQGEPKPKGEPKPAGEPGSGDQRVSESKARLVFLDNLKVFLTLLVILHHAAITYGGSGGWFYQEVKQTILPDALVLTAFVATNQCYFMGLFFFISGCFMAASLARKTQRQFVLDKLLRLGVPVLLFVFALYPLTIWLGYYPFTWASARADLPKLMLDIHAAHTGPTWFVAVLLVFNLLAVALWNPLSRLAGRLPDLRAGDFLLVGIVIGMVSFITRLVFPDGFTLLNIQLSYLPQYIFYFMAGAVMGAHRVVPLVCNQRVAPWLVSSILLISGLMIAVGILLDTSPFVGGINPYSMYYSMSQGFISVALSIVALTLFYRHANRRPWWRGLLSRAAYGAFFIHAPVLVGLTLLTQPISLTPMLKFVLLGCLGVPLSFALGYLLTNLPVLKRVF
jgi:glucans biosynthesis protein C